MTPLEQERLDVADSAVRRLLALYKAKPRTGKGKGRLLLIEGAAAALEAARLL